MNKKTHEITLSGYKAAYSGNVLYLGTKESYGSEQLHITLGEEWKDCVVTAIFSNRTSTEVPMDAQGMIPVPPEATLQDTASFGPGRIVFKGTTDSTQLLTADLFYFVEDHAASRGSNSLTPTPDQFTQFVNAVKADSIPDYVLAEVERLAAVVQSRQNENTVSFMACSDIHFSDAYAPGAEYMPESLTDLGLAMRLLRERVYLDFAVCLGDQIWDSGSETTEELRRDHRTVHSHLSPAFLSLPALFTEGNHDVGSNNPTPLTPAQVYFHTGAYNSSASGYYTAEKALGACYLDFPRYKLRVILLNTNSLSGGQVDWLANVLDVSGKEDGPWGTLVLAHHPVDDSTVHPGILAAMREAPGLIAQVHGHTHNCIVRNLGNTNIPGVAVMSASPYRRNECASYADQYIFGEYNEDGSVKRYPTAAETAGTARNTSFSVITLDPVQKMLYVDRYGCGENRTVEIADWTVVSTYINRLPSALSFDGTGVFNGTGYKDGAYISTSPPYYGADAETVCTGLIPYVTHNIDGVRLKPPTIYIKGVTLDPAKSHHRMGFVRADFAGVFTTKKRNEWDDVFEVTELGEQYYKIEPLLSDTGNNQIWDTWQFKTDYIAYSAGGTGENLIIT
ncbi:MAG: metallophosphoesterase, partial [Clostridia bacterium]|nr:metallophosphoesterase [Clostridia bacterium]